MTISVYNALKSHDEQRHMTSVVDGVGALVGILVTSILTGLLTTYQMDFDETFYAMILGTIRAVQCYFGAVTVVAILSAVFPILSPVRYILRSLIAIIGAVAMLSANQGYDGFNPLNAGMFIAFALFSLVSVGHLVSILFKESCLCKRLKEVRRVKSLATGNV